MSRIFLSPPHVGGRERALLLEAFDSNWIAPLARTSTRSSRSSRPDSAPGTRSHYRAAPRRCTWRWCCSGWSPGDKVVVPTLTFCASANPVLLPGRRAGLHGRRERDTWNVDPGLVDEELADAASGAARRPRP